MSFHGLPAWYELCTQDVKAATDFYGKIFGWSYADAGMEGFAYTLASGPGGMVAGIFNPGEPMPSFWLTYFAVTDIAASAAKLTEMGGSIHRGPDDIPGTGKFLIATDPQGATFGLWEPIGDAAGTAYDPKSAGHGHWHQLQTPDTAAALAFYSAVLGWKEDRIHPMGDLGPYRVVSAQGQEMGGIMAMMTPDLPPHWMPFFGSDSVSASVAAIAAAKGKVVSGPDPVPGGVMVATADDGTGTYFSIVGKA